MRKRGLYHKKLAGVCIRCQAARRRPGQQWCAACHAAYQRAWRKARAQVIRDSGLFAQRGSVKVPFN
jgi:hypothetical protein